MPPCQLSAVEHESRLCGKAPRELSLAASQARPRHSTVEHKRRPASDADVRENARRSERVGGVLKGSSRAEMLRGRVEAREQQCIGG